MKTEAIKYAEHYGIIEYTLEGSIMKYEKYVYGEGQYTISYNLETGEFIASLET